MRKEFSKIP